MREHGILHITITNDQGEVVVDEDVQVPLVTSQEVDKMVSLINSGVPAHKAASLVLKDSDCGSEP